MIYRINLGQFFQNFETKIFGKIRRNIRVDKYQASKGAAIVMELELFHVEVADPQLQVGQRFEQFDIIMIWSTLMHFYDALVCLWVEKLQDDAHFEVQVATNLSQSFVELGLLFIVEDWLAEEFVNQVDDILNERLSQLVKDIVE